MAHTSAATELSAMVDAVGAGHASLDAIVFRLRGLCQAIRDGEAPESAQLLEQFEVELLACLVAEDAEEYFGSLVTEEPQLLESVGRLQEEQGEMAEAVDRLVELASDRPAPDVLADRLGRFLDWLAAHEKAEHALMRKLSRAAEGMHG